MWFTLQICAFCPAIRRKAFNTTYWEKDKTIHFILLIKTQIAVFSKDVRFLNILILLYHHVKGKYFHKRSLFSRGRAGIFNHTDPYLMAFSLCGIWFCLADPLVTGRKWSMLSVFTPRFGVRWMRAGLIRRSCTSHFMHTRWEKGSRSNIVPCPISACMGGTCSRFPRQQEVKLLPVSSLLLQPGFQHHLYVENAVLDLLQLYFCTRHETIW